MNHFLDNRITDPERLHDETVAAAFVPGMGATEFVAAFIDALPEKNRLAWKKEGAIAFCAQQRVREQLETEYEELMAKRKLGNS